MPSFLPVGSGCVWADGVRPSHGCEPASPQYIPEVIGFPTQVHRSAPIRTSACRPRCRGRDHHPRLRRPVHLVSDTAHADPNVAEQRNAVFVGGTGTAVYRYDVSAATVAMAANLPLAGGVSFNGRLGAAFTATRLRGPSTTGTIATNPPNCSNAFFFDDCTATKTNFLWGLGVQFDVNPRFGIRLDYDNYGKVGEEFETGRAKIEALSANVLFRF